MTCFIAVVNMFFQHGFEKHFKYEKNVLKSIPNKASIQNIFKTSLEHFKNIFKFSNC